MSSTDLSFRSCLATKTSWVFFEDLKEAHLAVVNPKGIGLMGVLNFFVSYTPIFALIPQFQLYKSLFEDPQLCSTEEFSNTWVPHFLPNVPLKVTEPFHYTQQSNHLTRGSDPTQLAKTYKRKKKWRILPSRAIAQGQGNAQF